MWSAWEERVGRVKEGLERQGEDLRVLKVFDWEVGVCGCDLSCSVSSGIHSAHTYCVPAPVLGLRYSSR